MNYPKHFPIGAKTILVILAVVFVITFNSCQKEEIRQGFTLEKALKVSERNLGRKDPNTPDPCADIHFTYEGEDGPENWAGLCEEWAECGEGQAQSPINIETVIEDPSLRALDFRWGKTTTNIVNNGHTVQFNVDEGSRLIANGKIYQLLQFHFHQKSEHTIKGEHRPLEVHYVHKALDGKMAVVSVLFKIGEPNSFFARFLSRFPQPNNTFSSTASIDLHSLLPDDLKYYNYEGSLTTPACSETVNWFVVKGSVTLSEKQLQQVKLYLFNNYRPTQPLNGRTVRMSTESENDVFASADDFKF